ncbi:cation acetate symporter [Stappia taiwanensis]|uniref:Cation acetate symporter n=1 Tax=Stappia taiwanensis TaxID=992267 RepID=A0A838XU03_9HYPH|nr:sodium:solute symporter family protein [Stappia taiwanensis]MBA4612128.1 cation acetate symporter [Stappia taiwanensis]GGE93399.1 sodium:solute symporter [Stappia taiwanensis]
MRLPSPEDTFLNNLGRIYGTYVGGFVAFVILLAVLEQLGVPDRIIGYLFVFFTLAVYAGIGIVTRTVKVSEYYVAGRQVPAVYNGMATAADWMSGASFVGLAGTLYALGYDGLAYVLGWTGGFVLVAVLVAPYLRKFGAYTVPDFLAARFGGNFARLLGIVVLFACSFTYVVAQIYSTGIIASRFLGISFEIAIYVGLAGILLCSMLGGMRAVTWTQVAQYLVLIIAYMLPVAILSAQKFGLPIAQITYGAVLQEITVLEQQLLAGGLATAETLKPHLAPFTSLDPFNFFALIACLMIGTASLPHLLMRYFTTASVRDARRSVGWSLLFIFLLYVTAPAYAAFAKLEVYQNVIGAGLDALPEWIYTYGRLGLVDICGAHAASVEAVQAACAEVTGNQGVLRLPDLAIDRDVIVIATPEIAGLPYVIAGLVAAGGLAASISTADGLLLALANALSHDVYYRMIDRRAPASRRLLIARLLLLGAAVLAAYVASTRPADILSMVAWAFSLAAAGNFPVLVLGIWWRRCTSAGAIAGIIAGFGVTFYYLVMTQYGGMPEWYGVKNISAAVFGLPVGFAVTILVSLLTPAPSSEVQALIDDIRRPSGDPVMRDRTA